MRPILDIQFDIGEEKIILLGYKALMREDRRVADE